MNEEPDEPRPIPRGKVELRVIGGANEPRRPVPEDEARSEAVVRLENSEVLKLSRSVEDYQQVPMPDESARWRGKRWLTMRTVTAVMIAGVVLITIGVVAAVLGTRKQDSGVARGAMVLGGAAVDDEPRRDDAGLAREMDRLREDAEDLIVRIAAAERPEDLEGIVRGGETVRKLMAERWEPLRLEEADLPGVAVSQHMASDMTWLTARGRDSDGEPMELVFFMEDDRLVYDWAASWGIGEVPFEELRSLAPERRVTMRVVATKSNFHTSAFPEEAFECFRLHHAAEQEPVWGYVRRGGAAQAELDRLMNRDSTLLARVSQLFVMVVLENTGQANFGQLEIVEIARPGWIEK